MNFATELLLISFVTILGIVLVSILVSKIIEKIGA